MMSNNKSFDFVILHIWYWNWDEDESFTKEVLFKNDENLDIGVRKVVSDFSLFYNRWRPKTICTDKNKLTGMMIDDINSLHLSKQNLCEYTNRASMNILTYTDTMGDGHIEVMGVYTNTYELLKRD